MNTTGSYEPSAPARAREQALIRDMQRLMNGDLKPDEAQMVRFASAESVRLGMHRSWCRPEVPERPPEFPADDEELIRSLRWANRNRASEEDRRLASSFGSWRYAVWLAESEGAVRVLVLLSVVDDYQRILDAVGGDARVEALRDEVLAFLSDEWGCNVPAPEGYVERREFAARLAKLDVLPRSGRRAAPSRESAPVSLGEAIAADARLPPEREW